MVGRMQITRFTVTLCATLGMALAAVSGPAAAAPSGPDVGPMPTAMMHGDPYSTDTTPHRGPGRTGHVAASSFIGSGCTTTMVGRDGIPVAMCTLYVGKDLQRTVPSVTLFDPVTAKPLANLQLPRGALYAGAYGYLDSHDRVVVAAGEGKIYKVAHRKTSGGWKLWVDETVDISASLGTGDAVNAINPDFEGRLWFVTGGGTVGVIEGTKVIATLHMPAGELIKNSMSNRPGGRASVLTDTALYEMRLDGDRITTVWRRAYDSVGGVRRAGQLSYGSGTTPTYFGPGGSSWVAIVDNGANPHLKVFRSSDGSPVCSMPAFHISGPGTENSPIGWRNSLVISSTYGFEYPDATVPGPSTPRHAPFTGGLTRIDVTPQGCRRVWESGSRNRVSTLPKLSTSNGEIHFLGYAAQPTSVAGFYADPVYYSAVDFATGKRTPFTQVGVSPLDDPLQFTGTITADGTLWQGNATRMLKITP